MFSQRDASNSNDAVTKDDGYFKEIRAFAGLKVRHSICLDQCGAFAGGPVPNGDVVACIWQATYQWEIPSSQARDSPAFRLAAGPPRQPNH